jgi:tetratricopeptide (TPR) repeat protein
MLVAGADTIRTETLMTPRHPTARRVQRENQPEEDAFVAKVLETSTWARENSRLITITTIVVAIIVVGFLYYRNQRVTLRDRAETELSQVRTSALSGNAALAVRDLETFLQRFGETAAAPEARLLLGKAYIETGEPAKTVVLLKDQAADPTSSMGFEAAAEPDQAVATYLQIGDRAPADYQKATALENAARVRLEQGNAAGAVEIYDRILSIVPDDSPDRPVIEMRKAEAAARALDAGS